MFRFFTENGASYGLCRLFSKDVLTVQNSVDISGVRRELETIYSEKRNGIFVGFIDDDKRKQAFFEQFEEVFNNHGVKLKRLGNLFLVVLSPQVDGFIFTNASEKSVDLSNYSFQNNLKKFAKSLKTYGIERNSSFKSLTNDLKQKKAPCFIALGKAFDFIYKQK